VSVLFILIADRRVQRGAVVIGVVPG